MWAVFYALGGLVKLWHCGASNGVTPGSWGAVIGWPVLISGSIGIGILWGFWRGEWEMVPASAARPLSAGLLLILVAVLALASANAVRVNERNP